VKYAWIDSHRDCFCVASMCRLLGVSRSGLHDWLRRAPSRRSQEDARLVQELRVRHARHRGKYGRPRLTADLRADGFAVNHKRVHRLMRREGLRARTPRRFVRTTDSRHAFALAPNVLGQKFVSSAPNRVWLADITYVATGEGWLYVAIVMDLYSRKFVGWAMSAQIDGALVLSALRLALGRRRPGAQLLHHSDRGCQYTSAEFRRRLELRGITASMSRRANCYDNATMESFWATLKTECFGSTVPTTRTQARSMVFDYIETFYNPVRLHSALGFQSPVAFELSIQNN
jgi:putative transposase